MLIAALALVVAAPDGFADPAGLDLLSRVRDTWQATQTLTYSFKKEERLKGGEIVREAVEVKLRRPAEFYIAAVEPERGQEVIYSARRDPKVLIVHTGSFPDITITLRVESSLATKRQHHLVTHSGFEGQGDSIRTDFEQPLQLRG